MTPAQAFAAAASSYEAAAVVQRLSAGRLAARIAALALPPRPRILEVGAGTGFLARALAARLPDARLLVTDIAPAMAAEARRRLPPGLDAHFAVMSAEAPATAPGFDVVCCNFAAQWFTDQPAALSRLLRLCAPGGWLASATLVEGTLEAWREASQTPGLAYPAAATLTGVLPGATVETETILQAFASGLDFLRGLRDIGATGGAPPAHRDLRRALARFEQDGAAVAEFRVATIIARKPTARGLFVTGTDTGIGKTLAAACLVRRLGADYWKPAQTGTADGDDDTACVAALAGLSAERIHPPRYAFAAPLSPEAAAAREGVAIGLADFALPASPRPIVVEGAGGVLVPIGGGATMADLMRALGLPAVLVARSTLGTINHTLLSLEALRLRGVPVQGVILIGPPNPGNRAAIETHGQVRILAEIPPLERIDAATVARLATTIAIDPGPAADA